LCLFLLGLRVQPLLKGLWVEMSEILVRRDKGFRIEAIGAMWRIGWKVAAQWLVTLDQACHCGLERLNGKRPIQF
jgi:hypothetical protein